MALSSFGTPLRNRKSCPEVSCKKDLGSLHIYVSPLAFSLSEGELRRVSGVGKVEIIPVTCYLHIAERLRNVFSQSLSQVFIHAAAYKHVPLLESNASDAVLKRIGGTIRLLECAARFEVERCVMVSTDNAVNPKNIMVATKRVAELMFQAQATKTGGHYSCVRFGKVLNSRGSVVPIFHGQIKL